MSSRSLYTPCYVLLLPRLLPFFFFFFFNDTATTEIYTLSLHDALPIYIELVEGHGVHRPGGQLRDQRRQAAQRHRLGMRLPGDRKSTRLNSSHGYISYAVFCLKKKKQINRVRERRITSNVVITNNSSRR